MELELSSSVGQEEEVPFRPRLLETKSSVERRNAWALERSVAKAPRTESISAYRGSANEVYQDM